ncbi:hypothetical protein BS78_K233300 [Paspalum vaginatum]|uniref:RRM domain-containing protein n=1 Tax=Paspalum vaginatum TaxID=158149 RepID=A0A9W7XEF0_9POAL|nr:hypothetical protein BS78_K233300 [Paspalum vaginatum]
MPAAADPAEDGVDWRPRADLPLDLLRDISRHLHAATDYARFHAVCVPWHDALPPARSRPAFLPWLLAPSDGSGNRKARCVFVSPKSSRRCCAAGTEIVFRDRRWVISTEDGVADSVLTTCRPGSSSGADVNNPLARSAMAATLLPSLPSDDATTLWVDHAVGTVSGDGTIFLYVIDLVSRPYTSPSINVALLRPGDSDWTLVRQKISSNSECAAYSSGKIVVCDRYERWGSQRIEASQVGDHLLRLMPPPVRVHRPRHGDGKAVHSCHVLESRVEILLASVLVDRGHHDYWHRSSGYRSNDLLDSDFNSVGNFAAGLLVSRDGRSLADRVMFLGWPSSFAVDAARFGMSGAGCAYFNTKCELYGGIWSKSPLYCCRVFKYSFHDGKSELVQQLPSEWSRQACTWLTPQPSISSTEVIYWIYVGNLSRKVDSHQLRQFFSKNVKVVDARRSRGFGFVTMTMAVDDEPLKAIAKLDGQVLDGRPLRVKFADPEQR